MNENNPTVVYHWWARLEENPVCSNLSHPIILSIATLRSVNKNINVIVYDCSEHENDWKDYKEKLNFSVIKCSFYLKTHYSHIKGYELLSRIFDIRRMQNGQIIYCDSDIFWLKDPLPLICDIKKFCFDNYNSGFFYCDLSSDHVKKMLDIFEAYTITALNNKEFCSKLKLMTEYQNWPYVWDEIVLTYMLQDVPELFEIIPVEEHMFARSIFEANKNEAKLLHCNGMMISNPNAKIKYEKEHSRGLVCLMFEEFYSNIKKVLSEDQLIEIYTEKEIKDCLSEQTSLFNKERFVAANVDKFHYHFTATNLDWLI